MNTQLVVANDDQCSDRYHEPVDCTHMMDVNTSNNIVSMASIKEKRSYDEAKKRAAAVAETLDW